MKPLRNHYVGIDQGEVLLFSDFEQGGPMWAGSGPRTSVSHVEFSQRFSKDPAVHVSVVMWDIDSKSNQRADVSTDQITRDGFNIVFHTWGDTRIARVRVSWMAIGELQNDDDWFVD